MTPNTRPIDTIVNSERMVVTERRHSQGTKHTPKGTTKIGVIPEGLRRAVNYVLIQVESKTKGDNHSAE